jgi:two-component system sensor histidine kinase YesM
MNISDNGVGIDAETLRQLQKKLQADGIHDSLQVAEGQGLALVNIHNRLRNHFGAQYGLRVSCPPEGGTQVVLCFPCTFAGQNPQPN